MKNYYILIIFLLLLFLIITSCPDNSTDSIIKLQVEFDGEIIDEEDLLIIIDEVLVGTSGNLVFTLRNIGDEDINFNQENAITLAEAEFTLDGTIPEVLETGQSIPFTIIFTPIIETIYTCEVTIGGDNADVTFVFEIQISSTTAATPTPIPTPTPTPAPTDDETAPSGYGVSIDNTVINAANENNFSFTLSAAEVGTTCEYSIDDTNGGTPAVTGSFSVVTGTDTQSGINVSSLDDDTITLTIYLVDAATNQGVNVTDTVEKDTATPAPGGGGTITTASITQTGVNLNWTQATDAISTQGNLQYKVVRSGSNNLNTVNDANSGTTVQDWAAYSTPVTAGSLNPDTTYYFNVIVRDEAGNMQIYTAVSETTEPLIPDDYIIRYNFDNNGNDELAGNHLVTSHGTPGYDSVDFKEGTHSLVLDGATDMVSSGNLAFGDNTFSFSVWGYINAGASNYPTLFDWAGSEVGIYYDETTDELKGYVDAQDPVVVTNCSDGTWYHMVLVYNGTNLYFYVNGSEYSQAKNHDRSGASEPLILGSYDNTDYFWDGKVDDFIIYNRALSASEVTDIYNAY